MAYGAGVSVISEQAAPSGDRRRRIGWGIVVGLLVAVVVAVPAFWTVLFAAFSFTGCFIECNEPQPAVGALWAGLSVLLVLTPVFAGMTVARAARRSRAIALGAVAVAGAGALWVLIGVG